MAFRLTAQQIYDKEFPSKEKGYDADQVDSFLDDIIEDYQDFDDQSRELSSALIHSNERVVQLEQENKDQAAKLADLQEQLKALTEQVATLTAENEALSSQAQEAKEQAEASAKALEEAKAAAEEEKEEEKAEPLTLEERVARLEAAVFASH